MQTFSKEKKQCNKANIQQKQEREIKQMKTKVVRKKLFWSLEKGQTGFGVSQAKVVLMHWTQRLHLRK